MQLNPLSQDGGFDGIIADEDMAMAKVYSIGEITNEITRGLDIERGKSFVRWGDGNGTFVSPSECFDNAFRSLKPYPLGEDPEVRAYELFFEGLAANYQQIYHEDCDADVDQVGSKFFKPESR